MPLWHKSFNGGAGGNRNTLIAFVVMLRVVLCLVVVGFRTFVEWRECDSFRQVGTRVGTRVARECGEFVAHDIGGEFIGRR